MGNLHYILTLFLNPAKMKKWFIIFVFIVALFATCTTDNDVDTTIEKTALSGYVQKGPFISGSSILINELNKQLSQTGKVYTSQIENNQGLFEIRDIKLASRYISIRADGFYFNEITGKQSVSQITLNALSDIKDKESVNINILSHLEKPRIEYLMKGAKDFAEAKMQAQSEVAAIFGFHSSTEKSSEMLNITEGGESNAQLLAASVILLGYRTEGEITELLSNLASDIKEDGIVSDSSLGSKLMNHAVVLDTVSIRRNLENRYQELEYDAVIPNFEHYLTLFIDSSGYELTESPFKYPQYGSHGPNILDPEKLVYTGQFFSLAAELSRGTTLMIKMTALSSGVWYYEAFSPQNWKISTFDFTAKTQTFTAIEPGKTCDLKMIFDSGTYRIEYFEMGSQTPSRTKTFTKP